MTDAPRPTPLPELDRIDAAGFARLRQEARPAVLRGLADRWPAVAAARDSDEALVAYVEAFAQDRPLSVVRSPVEAGGRMFYADDTLSSMNFTRTEELLRPLLAELLALRGTDPAPVLSLQSTPMPVALPGFGLENRIDLLDASIRPRVWIGNRIEVMTHHDLSENIGVVVAGRRRFTLFPPEQLANLYVGPFHPTPAGAQVSLVDAAAPDLDRFPRYAEAMATAMSAELGPGDAIYIPYHWWHRVESLDPFNLFVNYWWNEARTDAGRPYDAMLHALLAVRTLPPEQRAAWKAAFDYYVFETSGDPVAHLPADAQGLLGPPTGKRLERIRNALRELVAKLP
jgi:hypothetical protein